MRQGDAREAWIALRGWQYLQGARMGGGDPRTNVHRQPQSNVGCPWVCLFVHIHIFQYFQ